MSIYVRKDRELPPPLMPMGFVPSVIRIGPNTTHVIQLQPQLPVRPYALFVPERIASSLMLNDFSIGRDSQLVNGAPVPMELFAWTCEHEDCETTPGMMEACIAKSREAGRLERQIRIHLGMDAALPGIFITISIANISSSPVQLMGAVLVKTGEAAQIELARSPYGQPLPPCPVCGENGYPHLHTSLEAAEAERNRGRLYEELRAERAEAERGGRPLFNNSPKRYR